MTNGFEIVSTQNTQSKKLLYARSGRRLTNGNGGRRGHSRAAALARRKQAGIRDTAEGQEHHLAWIRLPGEPSKTPAETRTHEHQQWMVLLLAFSVRTQRREENQGEGTEFRISNPWPGLSASASTISN
jgi:hypothetical protein